MYEQDIFKSTLMASQMLHEIIQTKSVCCQWLLMVNTKSQTYIKPIIIAADSLKPWLENS